MLLQGGAIDEARATKRAARENAEKALDLVEPRILELAAANARAAGLRIETRVMDGEAIDVPEGSFDAVISRVGLIYFPDQQRALGGMKRALRSGGRLGAIVYGPADKNQFFSIPVSIIRRRAALPPPAPGQPGPFSLGGSGVLAKALEAAGFREVEVRAVPAPLRTTSAADCVRFERESFGSTRRATSSWSRPKGTTTHHHPGGERLLRDAHAAVAHHSGGARQ